MKKVLVITYYWPPSGGAGVQRWLKFVKYLRLYEWEPVIYTPSNPEFPEADQSLLKDVPPDLTILTKPVWEPYHLYKRLTGKKKEEKIQAGFLSEKKSNPFLERISVWIRGNLFIPDARKFWIKPSVRFLTSNLKDNPVDAIISTGPPHSMHMIALGVKENLGVPWLADFRDPWTGIDFYDKLKLSRLADKKHRRLEKNVLSAADCVVTVSKNWAADLNAIFPRKIEVVTNGFDPDDFKESPSVPDEKFSITHIGSLNKDRNPLFLWTTLRDICQENKEFEEDLEIKFIGKTDIAAFEDLEQTGLMKNVTNIPYLAHHEVVIRTSASQVLLLPVNYTPNMKGIIPGKVFEYLAAKRPIICIAPEDGDSAGIIKETGAGYVIGYGNSQLLKKTLLELYGKYKTGGLTIPQGNIDKFSRKLLAGSIAGLLNNIS